MGVKATTPRPKRRKRRWPFLLLRWFTIACLLVLGLSIGLLAGLYYSMSRLVPSNPSSLDFRPSDATRIYSMDGVLLARLYEENREVIKITEIPDSLQKATVAIEDKRFYDHIGFDPRGILRAAVRNFTGGLQQGASTITQQLARNVYLTKRRTVARKIHEIALATALERRFSKEQILEMYLNEVYYGSGAYGVQAASLTYFNKPAKDLTLAESALIAGLTQRPTYYSPFNDPDAAVGRRNLVLQKMLEQGFITSEEASAAKSERLRLAGKPKRLRWKAPHFVNYVLQQVSDEFDGSTVYKAGLQIYTTLDYSMQQMAEQAVREGVRRNRSRRVSQGALVSMDPHTGYVRAMVGGVDFDRNQFNVVTQGRPQTGSTFKPIVYTAALESGKTPYSREEDKPIKIRPKYWPENYNHRYSNSKMTYIRAVSKSVNTVAVRVARDVGVDKVISCARAMGITGPLPEDLTIALGSASLPPIQICTAYCAFANGGHAVQPIAIERITTADGGVIKDYKPSLRRVMTEKTAEGMDRMLRSVVTSGTGTSVRRVSEARGKTGTTDEDRHAWFVGYTPELVTAVWVGNDRPMPMRQVWGGNVCAPIWADFMQSAVSRQKQYNSKHNPTAKLLVTRHDSARRSRKNRNRPSDSYKPYSSDDSQAIDEGATSGADDQTANPDARNADLADDNSGINDNADGNSNPATQYEYVTLTICGDSGLIANHNCPHVVRRRYRSDQAPNQVCGRH